MKFRRRPLNADRTPHLHAGDCYKYYKLLMQIQACWQLNLWCRMTVLENIIEAPIHVLKVPKADAATGASRSSGKSTCSSARTTIRGTFRAANNSAQRSRALATEPEVMLFGEPTSALDRELVGEVLRVLHKFTEEGRTLLVVAHEMGFAREVSDQVLFLHERRVEEYRPPKEVFGSPKSERFRQFLAGTLK